MHDVNQESVNGTGVLGDAPDMETQGAFQRAFGSLIFQAEHPTTRSGTTSKISKVTGTQIDQLSSNQFRHMEKTKAVPRFSLRFISRTNGKAGTDFKQNLNKFFSSQVLNLFINRWNSL